MRPRPILLAAPAIALLATSCGGVGGSAGMRRIFALAQALVWKMEAYAAEQRPYIQLVDTDALSAHSDVYTSPKPAS